ncbi:histone family protein DNA-binding protein [endosymbiont of Acanthamoeba sp. UWC8]|uniref:DNA-binding protein HU-alpha n=1 Tax=Candidatus Jidaibacter acanthamoebae TaxID=86105 RepID=A0A0C1QFE5_9RICK|nr:HU family DNA-binding protein [Candidatus Jidaibacter acanthamoeba]AIF81517.1 histone family protein DNA-binding protein [endosymbiont of Acanthamoeba sp. UWC8]KIE04279.1 DNA-binding protein HU-alpha [Candidatus Jidaibacter acanthamoeba]
MNKEELISALSAKTDATKVDSKKHLEALLEVVQEVLVKGDSLQLVGFGTFAVSDVKAKEGINPQTREKIKIPASKRVKFSVGKQLKEAVNHKNSKKK